MAARGSTELSASRMTYLIDTDWVISFLKGRRNAETLLGDLYPRGLAISAVTYGEALEGFIDLPDSLQAVSLLEGFILTLQVLSVYEEISRRYAYIRRDLRRRGQLIADNDLWIAATALVHDLQLVTRDRHFERVPDLKLYRQVR